MDSQFIGVIWTSCGFFDVRDPDPNKIALEDIALSLSRQSRFCGHTRADLPAYNVALHCLFCEQIADYMNASLAIRAQALFHDAAEAYLMDMIAPIKEMFPLYRVYERNLMDAIFTKFEIPSVESDAVKKLDLLALEAEAAFLLPAQFSKDSGLAPLTEESYKLYESWFKWVHGFKDPQSMAAGLFLARARALLSALGDSGNPS